MIVEQQCIMLTFFMNCSWYYTEAQSRGSGIGLNVVNTSWQLAWLNGLLQVRSARIIMDGSHANELALLACRPCAQSRVMNI